MTSLPVPNLEGDALRAVQHRGSHLQIIACAGSGKTEVVAQRVADLLAEGADARSIIAFTFTERAAQDTAAVVRYAARGVSSA
jgi:DNA helicase-2/ATP-dependent DNA helicase PcrA